MAAQRTIKVDVISDFGCPWCYIGFLDLDRAIQHAHKVGLPVTFEVQYHPFILNPQLCCNKPVQKAEYFKQKFGEEKFAKIRDMVVARAKEEGLTFSFDGVLRQTTRAHRLMLHAYRTGGQDVQLALLRKLFKAYFEEARDIGDIAVLASLAADAGVTFPDADPPAGASETQAASVAEAKTEGEDEKGKAPQLSEEEERRAETVRRAAAFLATDALEAEVRAMSAAAQKKGITGVPFSVIDGRWAVSGCQPDTCYYKIFQGLAKTEPKSPHEESPRAPATVAPA